MSNIQLIIEERSSSEGNAYSSKQLLVAEDGSLCSFTIGANSTLYLFGGEPFPEERFINWNFVSSNRDMIEAAKQKWIAEEFPGIPGDDREYIPYPGTR